MAETTRRSLKHFQRDHRVSEPRLIAGTSGLPPRELYLEHPDALARHDAYTATLERMAQRGRERATLRAKADTAAAEYRAARHAAADAGEDPGKIVDKSPKLVEQIAQVQAAYDDDARQLERQGRSLAAAMQDVAIPVALASENLAREAVTRARDAYEALTLAEADYREHAGTALTMRRLALYGGTIPNLRTAGKGLPGFAVATVDFDTAASLPDQIATEAHAVEAWRTEQEQASAANTAGVRVATEHFTTA